MVLYVLEAFLVQSFLLASLLGEAVSGTLISSKKDVEEFVEETFSGSSRNYTFAENHGLATINPPTTSLSTFHFHYGKRESHQRFGEGQKGAPCPKNGDSRRSARSNHLLAYCGGKELLFCACQKNECLHDQEWIYFTILSRSMVLKGSLEAWSIQWFSANLFKKQRRRKLT